jgi:shikimate kinase
MRIYLIGFMGCGKTHWGKELSAKLQVPFFDLDEKIEEREGKSIVQLFAEQGEEAFRKVEKETLHILTESHPTFVMATGGGTACYYNNIDYMKKRGTTVWLNCSIGCLFSRLVKEREKRPLIKHLDDDQLRAYISRKFSDRKIFYQQAAVILNEETVSLENLMQKIFHPQ